jgi:uncharacterized protein (TIGR03790 family)
MTKLSISIFTCFLFCFSTHLLSQSVNYDDVVVIVNDSSPVSITIGNYFAAARGIPPNRILHVQAPDQETIDSLEFETMRSQIEAGLMVGNLLDTVNYLVTTKGMPLRISRNGACDSLPTGYSAARCTCVEGELPLILGPESGEILQNGLGPNYYASADRHFDRDTFGIFLVSRLDGFTEQDVKDLIDRSGPGQMYSRPNARMVSDVSHVNPSDMVVWNNFISQLDANMQGTGVTFYSDPDSSVAMPPQQNLVGYYGVHYQPDLVQLGHTWEPGAMAYLHYDRPASTFDANNNPQGYLLLGDLINEGASVAIGYVFPGYLSPSTMASEMFPRYFDTLAMPRYNAAEAFYMGSNFLSNSAVMIGDPKTSVMADIQARVVIADENPLLIYPNPNQGRFVVQGDLPGGESILEVRNQLGQLVMQKAVNHAGGLFHQEIDLESAANGMYFLSLQRGDKRLVKKVVVEN